MDRFSGMPHAERGAVSSCPPALSAQDVNHPSVNVFVLSTPRWSLRRHLAIRPTVVAEEKSIETS